jgi:hypothetical protein
MSEQQTTRRWTNLAFSKNTVDQHCQAYFGGIKTPTGFCSKLCKASTFIINTVLYRVVYVVAGTMRG